MAKYCIGDLHGRYDLYCLALEKVGFNDAVDELYILGDAINKNSGGVKILQDVMRSPKTKILLKGNHEFNFLENSEVFDWIIYDDFLCEIMQRVVSLYSSKLYNEIAEIVKGKISKRNRDIIWDNRSVAKWRKTGHRNRREELLFTILDMIEYNDYDADKYEKLYRMLERMGGMFKTKPFTLELLHLLPDEYSKIKQFIANCGEFEEFDHCNKHFILLHDIREVHDKKLKRIKSNKIAFSEIEKANNRWPFIFEGTSSFEFPRYHMLFGHTPNLSFPENHYYIFGHEPTPKIHKKVSGYDMWGDRYGRTYFDFDYKEILSYIDSRNNHYYNLDLASNPVGILRLDDMEDFYVWIPPKNAESNWDIDEKTAISKRKDYRIVADAHFYGITSNGNILEYKLGKSGFAFVTYRDNCYEFLIGVNPTKKELYYTRVDYLDYLYLQLISNVEDVQAIEHIADIVRNDFDTKVQQTDHLVFEAQIRNLLETDDKSK